MDACIAVEHEVDKVLSKFGEVRENCSNVLQQLIDNLEMIKNNLQTNNSNDGKFWSHTIIAFLFKSQISLVLKIV